MSADVAAAQSAFCVALFDEFRRGGVTDVVVCPGSRSTPLVLALAQTPGLRTFVRLDERSAGFFAIGRTLSTGRPACVVVTSGTAAAELAAAVNEASLAGCPLVVITADRPPELRGVGAPQTIDQVKLFGGAVRRFEDPGPLRVDAAATWRPIAARTLLAAVEQRGPVHLNLPLVEPLDAPPCDVPEGRPGDRPWRSVVQPEPALGASSLLGPGGGANQGATASLPGLEATRGLLVAGRGAGDRAALCAAAARLQWPVLADALSGARSDDPHVVAAFDALLGDDGLRARLRPEIVVVLGAMPSSRALAEAIARWAPRVVSVTATGWPQDAHGYVSDVVVAHPSQWTAGVVRALGPREAAPSDYLRDWQVADAAAQGVFDAVCAGELTEPGIARLLSRRLLGRSAVMVSNSMPVRDLEWFGAKTSDPVAVDANRGANGIDGVVSTALGLAAGGCAVALLGDLAFLHDAGSLADGVGEHGGSCVLVVADNHGGGIFSFLPQRSSVAPDVFERAFGTPPRVEVAAVATGYGAEVATVKDLDALAAAVELGRATDGVTVVVAEVPDRDRNVELHRSFAASAASAARAALG